MTRNPQVALPAPTRLAGFAALMLLAAGCGGSSGADLGALRPSPSSAASSASPPPSASPRSSDPQTEARAIYYLHDDGSEPRLYREFHRRPVESTPTATVKDAVEAMLTSPAQDSDYTSLWSRQTIVRSVRITGTTAYVDLSAQARSANAGAASENASVQQLVHTVTAAANDVRSVQVLIEGKPAAELWGHVDVSKPVSRQPAAEILAPVWITTPDDGALATGGHSVARQPSSKPPSPGSCCKAATSFSEGSRRPPPGRRDGARGRRPLMSPQATTSCARSSHPLRTVCRAGSTTSRCG